MITRPLIFGFFSTVALLAEDAPRAVQIVEPPAPAVKIDGMDRAISNTGQFSIIGGEPQDRGNISALAEQAKDEFLILTGERLQPRDQKYEWKVPINITLHGKSGDPAPSRTIAMQILVGESGYRVNMDVHLSRGIEHERLKFAITTALIYERGLKNHPTRDSETRFLVPPWLVDGLREANAWRTNQSDRRFYEALFKSGGLFKIDDLFSTDAEAFDEMDAAMRAAFRVSAGSLVMALLEQPQGKEAFRSFLTEVAPYEGEMPALLRRHFPELNLSETSLAKWWALQLANIGGQNLATDILSVSRTETALEEGLRLNFRNGEGIVEQKDLAAWPEVAALPEPERVKAVQLAQDALVRLSYRCFPSYRPVISEYQIVLNDIARNKSKGLAEKITALNERRTTMRAKAQQARDYLDWFEITRARAGETTGVFEDYMRLKERLKSKPHRRSDDVSKYLDRMQEIFSRPGDPTTPAESFEQLNDVPELPPLLPPE
ncbi:hypothetical protein JIN84_01915 [Luteolibacter yonseiensis]|uniref:Uncharacterized protein n=1 Tax=Luteolibacter yonseiensis TaxID=1144680 RepID=A0A934R087_9BACT|nr:hypothetical protein [Luteolibacter yonseiensis]MBK1814349.1 hypothetical protein [Luteolibacter yonseiensis]